MLGSGGRAVAAKSGAKSRPGDITKKDGGGGVNYLGTGPRPLCCCR